MNPDTLPQKVINYFSLAKSKRGNPIFYYLFEFIFKSDGSNDQDKEKDDEDEDQEKVVEEKVMIHFCLSFLTNIIKMYRPNHI